MDDVLDYFLGAIVFLVLLVLLQTILQITTNLALGVST